MRTSDTAPLAVTGSRRPLRASGVDAPLLPALRTVARAAGGGGAAGGAGGECVVEVRARGAARPVPPDVAAALVAAARLAVGSAVRHGRASVVAVAVTFAPDRVLVAVRDDGAALPARTGGAAFGLRLLRRRLVALGGGLDISHGRRPGVAVRAWAALPPEAPLPESGTTGVRPAPRP
ncbi:MAG TPA: hypothetical protein VF519_03015 [Mycobacteriales bacterium]|jgi:hypothetical protein